MWSFWSPTPTRSTTTRAPTTSPPPPGSASGCSPTACSLDRTRATAADLDLALRLRDALHVALVGNHEGTPDLAALEAVGTDLPLRVRQVGDGPALGPVRQGVPGALSEILVAVMATAADDTWRRLKICSSDECAWAFYDATKNRSRTYCEWGCGNKIKSRNYRARQRAW